MPTRCLFYQYIQAKQKVRIMNFEKKHAWVVRGSRRIAIIKAMNKPQIPSQILRKSSRHDQKNSLSNTCGILRSFEKQGLAVCLNPEDTIGKLYQLTNTGEEIREKLLEGN